MNKNEQLQNEIFQDTTVDNFTGYYLLSVATVASALLLLSREDGLSILLAFPLSIIAVATALLGRRNYLEQQEKEKTKSQTVLENTDTVL